VVKSKFIANVLDLLTDAPDSSNVRQQVKYIEEDLIDYTPMGVFIYFKHIGKSKDYLLDNKEIVLDGVFLESDEFEGEAMAILHFSEGLIDNLEIYVTSGNYIATEPTSYRLYQAFQDSPHREIIVK